MPEILGLPPGALDELLADVATAPDSDAVLSRLFGTLLPRGEAYAETYAAIPRLVAIASGAGTRVLAAFATFIGRSVMDGDPDPTPGSELDRAFDWARSACDLLLEGPLELEEPEVWQLLVASAALHGEQQVAQLVDQLQAGEVAAECPQCYRTLDLVSDGAKAWLTSSDNGSGAPGERIERSQPYRDPDGPPPPPPELRRLAARARSAGWAAIADVLDTFDSRVQCPYCEQWSAAQQTVLDFRG